MTRKEAFTAINKLLFGGEDFTNAKCTDGTILQWTGDLKEGTALMVVGADGNQLPAEDKTYEVEDGSKITTVGGLITKIEMAAIDDPADMEQMQKLFLAFGEKFNTLSEKFTALETKLTAYDEKFTAIETVVNSTKTDATEKFDAIKTLVESIAAEPAADPIQQPKQFSKKKTEGKTAAEKIAEWKKTLNK